ncbi:hypothetical protein ACFXGT_15045 [Streptomyces sp. NPDC059352]|uniref:hypothetical protein n=1 Tax=Streptomyces sp. NPDC059352 TaxID=3346810 RepID=UPI0036ADD4AB
MGAISAGRRGHRSRPPQLGEGREEGIAFARRCLLDVGTGSVRAGDDTAELQAAAPPRGG